MINHLIRHLKALPGLLRRPFLKKLLGGIFTQGLLSAANFVIGISIAREASKEEYGIYVIAVSLILIFGSVQNGLVNSPLTVLLPEKKDREKDALLGGLALGQWLIFAPIMMIAAAGVFGYRFFRGDFVLGDALFVLLGVIPLTLLREFIRVVNYFWLKIRSVVSMDVVFVVFALGGIWGVAAFAELSGAHAIAILGVAAFFSVLAGHSITPIPYRLNWQWIKGSLSETWPYSRWALLGVAASNIRSYGHVYIISIMLTLQDTADVSAARLFLMPFGLFIASSQRIFLSKGAHLAGEKRAAQLRQLILSFLALFVSLWLAWLFCLVLFHDLLIDLALTAKYSNIVNYIFIWALVFLISSLRFVVTNSLQVFKEFKKLGIYGMISSALVVILCVALIAAAGPLGALISLGIADVAFMLPAVPLLVKSLRRLQGDDTAAGAIKLRMRPTP